MKIDRENIKRFARWCNFNESDSRPAVDDRKVTESSIVGWAIMMSCFTVNRRGGFSRWWRRGNGDWLWMRLMLVAFWLQQIFEFDECPDTTKPQKVIRVMKFLSRYARFFALKGHTSTKLCNKGTTIELISRTFLLGWSSMTRRGKRAKMKHRWECARGRTVKKFCVRCIRMR